jgi:UMF1 family MFS transporter
MTTVVTAVFPVYYLEIAGGLGQATAQERFSLATTLALMASALLAPVLGALADFRACKKLLLTVFALLGVGATAGMFWLQPGDWLAALVLFGLANVGAAGSIPFYDALLPHVAPIGEMDRLSTSGYALGYVGGGVLLVLNLAWIARPGWFGLPSGEGLTEAQATLPVRLALLSAGVWWFIFTLPLWRGVPEPPRQLEADERADASVLRVSFQRLGETLRELRRYRQAFRLLVAFLLYNDGIATIIRMAALYAAAHQLERTVLIGTIVAVQFVGIPCSLAFGALARRTGAKPMVLGGIAVYLGITLLAFFMERDWHFVALGLLVALVQGGTQALSRSLFASLIPAHKSAEFFGFFGVGEKFAGILGPLLFGSAIALTGSTQGAILTVIPFFVAGGLLLLLVDVEEGRRLAREAGAGVRLEPARGAPGP